ncbi:MAG: FAD-dependent oxidoreductase [Lachnospiraceae bacterium]|nr:FAD-dependent oxidoreductase [Lachnospiraceae bacterium]
MKSIWKNEIAMPDKKTLSTDREVDIAVIGAGMTGILTAYLLQQQGREVIVLEGDRIASGQTGNTTAKITSQHGLKYDTLIRTYGKNRARLYAKANEEAIRMYQKIVAEQGIECDFERLSAFLYSTQNKEALLQEAKAAVQLGLPASFVEQVALPFETVGAVEFENQAQFHPVKFILHLAGQLEIYEKTMVHTVKGHTIITSRGNVKANHIVFAVHYPFTILTGAYFLRQHQERSYVVAYKDAGNLHGMYYSIEEDGLSFRNYKDYLLIGGGKHRTGRKEEGGSYAAIRQKAKYYFPESREIANWSAQDCMTHDKLPLIGTYSVFRPYWYVATGFQKWGMTNAMISAMIIRDGICGVKNPYEDLFSPKRWHPLASAGNFLTDIGVSVKGLLTGYHFFTEKKEEDLECGHGGIVRKGLRRYGCYRDEEGKLHRVDIRCTHMGCELLWNSEERTWDCPCHGSRFDYDGNLIDNPAKRSKGKE